MSDQLGPYELRSELGRGAMAIVWRAFDPKLEREVAIKEPIIAPGTDPRTAGELAARFVREGKAAAKLNHPGIVTIFAADIYDGRPAIVMEIIEGETLSDMLRRGAMPARSALAVLDQLLDAVGYAHAHGVVHRDIKPDNVFVTTEGRVKLADFGIAHVGTGAALTQAGTVMGTPGYMAPEQVTGSPVDARADLFAIGVIGYELLTGRNPFGSTEGVASTTVMYRIVHEPMPALSPNISAGLPTDLTALLARATAKDPNARPASAAEFRAALVGGALPAGATYAAPLAAGAGATSSLPAWWPYAAVGAAGVLLVGGLLFFSGGVAPGNGLANVPTAPTTGASTSGTSGQVAASVLSPSGATASSHLDASGGNIYEPSNVLDGDPETTWAEGVAGYGVGEWLDVDFGSRVRLSEIRFDPGYDKDVGWDRWWANGRPRSVRFEFDDGTSETHEFRDKRGWQTVTLDARRMTRSVRIVIASVYKAKRVGSHGPYKDTSISEIEFTGWIGSHP